VRDLRAQDLQRHVATDEDVTAEADLPHPALAQDRVHHVARPAVIERPRRRIDRGLIRRG